jgi:GTP cyclohydrolase I
LAVSEAIQPSGVGVVIEAVHMCMVMRGVQVRPFYLVEADKIKYEDLKKFNLESP